MKTIFWHDYETFGVNPRRDRPCQFAGVRTDEDLNVIDDPVELFCKPAPDFLPDPEACLITGITPAQADSRGVSEAEFCRKIAEEFLVPGTCVAGYNSIRFDDEVTRNLLYRCFYDPYEREWKNGNSRWDIIDMVRMTYALRPEGIEWPTREDGNPSFRLEELTKANGISHADAHDAVSDVLATIAMAKLIKDKQPKLYDFLYTHRQKNKILPLLNLGQQEPVVHVSGMIPSSRGCLALVLPIAQHPTNTNGIIVYDLLQDPTDWLDASVADIQARIFTPTAELPEGTERIALKTIHINKCPAVAPLAVLTEAVQKRFNINMDAVYQARQQLLAQPDIGRKLQAVFAESGVDFADEADPDFMLYGGGFFDAHDKRQMEELRYLNAEQLSRTNPDFHDARLPELLFRFRARNFPHTLNSQEQQVWTSFCKARLEGESPGAGISKNVFEEKLLHLAAEQKDAKILQELREYADGIYMQLGIAP